jgi:AcrR family transcriptional regulator
MPRTELTEKQIETFRAQTVRAATRLFAKKGYEAVTMRALASKLRVSPMTIYRYFEDKEALFTMVRTDAFRRFADRQADAVKRSDLAAEETLVELGRAYIRFALDEPESYRIMFELNQKVTRSDAELETQQKRAFFYLHRAVEQAVESGHREGDPLTVAHIAWAQVHGIVSLHLAGKLIMGRNIEELIETTFRRPKTSGRQRKKS